VETGNISEADGAEIKYKRVEENNRGKGYGRVWVHRFISLGLT
jgi:hypothetical protein